MKIVYVISNMSSAEHIGVDTGEAICHTQGCMPGNVVSNFYCDVTVVAAGNELEMLEVEDTLNCKLLCIRLCSKRWSGKCKLQSWCSW
jgi:hypothetical protein